MGKTLPTLLKGRITLSKHPGQDKLYILNFGQRGTHLGGGAAEAAQTSKWCSLRERANFEEEKIYIYILY